MKLWPRAKSRPLRFHELRHTFGSVLIMSGANLVSVQKLLGHSNPKITAETYAHLAPDYLLAEVNLLRFGVDQLAPVAKTSQRLAAASTIRGLHLSYSRPRTQQERPDPPRSFPSDFRGLNWRGVRDSNPWPPA